jgi:cellulose synthase/poly-beta-1,6-N-acetylglucosamine synthase-like glycosyltransferase
MISLIHLTLWALACAGAVPAVVFCVECVLGALYRPRTAPRPEAPRPRIAVLVPAHNEAAGIAHTVTELRKQLCEHDTLLVVADNCSDDTAARAAASGARVVERHDPERRGKGYALAFGIEQLSAAAPDIVVIVDADCTVSEGGIEQLARLAHKTDCPVQADYVLTPGTNASGRSLVSALAFLVKNRVRPRGLAALGMPCLLTGTGMGFPWAVLRKAPPTHDNLVEDMVMGLQLALLGHPPQMCPNASVMSALPERQQAASAQRKRWEHGHLATLIEHGPRLFVLGIVRVRLELIALALDLMVPPLSLLAAALLGSLSLAIGAWLLGASALPMLLLAASVSALIAGTGVAWFAYGRTLIRARDLLAVPLYVLWKLPLYFKFFASGRQRGWQRTERSAESNPAKPSSVDDS